MARNICPSTFRRRSRSLVARLLPPSYWLRKERQRRSGHLEGEREPTLGQDTRNDRRFPTGAATTSRVLQHDVADRTAQLREADSLPIEPALIRRQGDVGFNGVSQKPKAVPERGLFRKDKLEQQASS